MCFCGKTQIALHYHIKHITHINLKITYEYI